MTDILESVQDAVQSAADEATEFAQLIIAKAEDAAGQVQDAVNEKPLTALGVVLMVGFVLAVLLRRPKVKVIYVRESG